MSSDLGISGNGNFFFQIPPSPIPLHCKVSIMAPKGILDMLAATPTQETWGWHQLAHVALVVLPLECFTTFQPQKKKRGGKPKDD